MSISYAVFCLKKKRRCLVIDPRIRPADLAVLAAELAASRLKPAAGWSTHPHWDHVLWSRELCELPTSAAPHTLSLHDALPISDSRPMTTFYFRPGRLDRWRPDTRRSEEHTSELQSHVNLVCRLLLEKKKALSCHRSADQAG